MILPDGFTLYNDQASLQDIEFRNRCNQSMDTLLVFSGLFSAVVTAFIIQTQQSLGKTPQDRSNDLLIVMIKLLNGTNPQLINNYDPTTVFRVSTSTVVANLFLFLSLILTLLAALGAMLVKQWLSWYDEITTANDKSPQEQARARKKARRGMEDYAFSRFVSTVPMILHVSLALFFVAL
ncbi:hypothetical protein CPB86DRAFT_718634, partial [Serendipita vermifera]